MEELQLSDYLIIIKRKRRMIAIITAALFGLALTFALNWSNYRATATVEVAQSDIPDSMATPAGMNAGSILESLADLRISRLQQKVLATGSLVEIITKFNLYAKERQTTPIADIAEKMRKKIKLDLVSSSLANPASAQKISAVQLSAIAFRLSFDYSNALLAQQVTNELVSRFLDEDLKERLKQSQETSAFLDSQIKLLESSLSEQEKKIAEFRAIHNDTRPEALAFNQQAAATTIMSLQNIESRIESNLGTQGALRGQLAMIDPYSRVLAEGQLLTTPTVQLKTLQSTYAALSAKYGPEHPDVVKAKRQIEAMQKSLDQMPSASAALQATIADVRGKLQTAQKAYGDQNPDVISYKRQLAVLEEQAISSINEDGSSSIIKKDADNPAYIQTVAQLKAMQEQYKALETQKATLSAQLFKYQKAIAQNPEAEQTMAELTRDYENTQLRYRDLKAKKMSADMTARIEEDRSGQRLVVINPPELPTGTQPSKLIFILAGFLFSLATGLAAAISVQLYTNAVVGARHLESLVGVAPLITVPHLVTRAEIERKITKKQYVIGAAFGSFVLILLIISYTIMPLDVLMSVITRKLGLG